MSFFFVSFTELWCILVFLSYCFRNSSRIVEPFYFTYYWIFVLRLHLTMIFLCYLSLLYNVTFCFVSIFRIYLPIIECFVNGQITFYHVNNIFESNSLNIKCHKHEIYSQINEYGVKKIRWTGFHLNMHKNKL